MSMLVRNQHILSGEMFDPNLTCHEPWFCMLLMQVRHSKEVCIFAGLWLTSHSFNCGIVLLVHYQPWPSTHSTVWCHTVSNPLNWVVSHCLLLTTTLICVGENRFYDPTLFTYTIIASVVKYVSAYQFSRKPCKALPFVYTGHIRWLL